ncbi:MAG TPA: acyl-CoA carboxylase subunit beta [Thermotogota bacterium]|jgi:acetyl-CoA carboxylase carboxyltransferase component|nr:acyl-CoA carboxylase subunit beta [Thermotogota bacterium]NLH19339.1 acyl-CoA carboxylase subunit beta [Thermotogaceae bacterium]OQC32277.1 MAG: Methylmalonyl-CoA carboxyltransferase 12S subunit [Thermotogota bacterium ADurb.Bin062]HNW46091.1 acyl-CoA carboxylase subunit beta [Thermotogota bacterium]HNY82968.1 acyl-CoA carboxylase subunit beta [Thermotogota bacterium]
MNDMDSLNQAFIEKRNAVYEGGGPKAVEKQHQAKKMTARERIHQLLDKGSFFEIDTFVQHRCVNFDLKDKTIPEDAVITGFGNIGDKKVGVFSQDFTVMGGSLGEMHAKKIMKIQDLCLKMGIPLIGINDSGGARIQEAVDALFGYGGIFFRNTRSSGVIPQISIIMGPCAGGAVYSPAITDFVIMVDQVAKMFITGPQVIKAVTGEDVSQEELGGAKVHNQKSGNAHFLAVNDEEALEICRRLFDYIPSNNTEFAKTIPLETVNLDNLADVGKMIPVDGKKGYDVKQVINGIVDRESFMEVHALYALNIVVGFARLGGIPIGVVANQPSQWAGSLDINASDKAARFIRFLDAFNLPIVTLVDTPGFLPGTAQEFNGIIRHGAKLLYAYSEAVVPKITVILRKAYGGAYIAMGSQHLGADFVCALPTGEIAVMGPEGAANIIFKKEIDQSENPEQLRTEKIEQYRAQFANPYVAASRGYIDQVISPDEMREAIYQNLTLAKNKVEPYPDKKHGNIPL